MTDTAAIQRTIYESVKARGYADGWTAEQFAARQVAKLAEELAEYAACFSGLPAFVKVDVAMTGNTCRSNFDMPELWRGAMLWDSRENAAAELSDIAVVLLCAAESLGVDILQLAQDKAARDVTRGVRA